MADNRIEKHNLEKVEESERANKIYEQTIALLKTEERFVNYFKGYKANLVESCIKYYAQQKADWNTHADDLHSFRQSKKSRWRKAALGMLKEIYIKKLFDLKCRWVAGEMDLPGIVVSVDFAQWEDDPSSCTALDPISSNEFNCYLSYLEAEAEQQRDDYYEEGSPGLALEFYHSHRSGFVSSYKEVIPEWFHHYDRRFGTAALLQLSIVRTDLEQDYHDIWSTEIHAKTLSPEQLKYYSPSSRLQRKEMHENPEKKKAYQEEQNRKYLEREKNRPSYVSLNTFDRKMMKELVALTEPPDVRKWHEALTEWRRRQQGDENIEIDLIYLKEAKEMVPIESNDDYRNSIKKAYADYASNIKMETLLLLFEEYCECKRSGNPFDWSTEQDRKTHANDLSKRLLAARKCKGEPDNLDFLKKKNLP